MSEDVDGLGTLATDKEHGVMTGATKSEGTE